MKTKTKPKSKPSATKPVDNQLTLDMLFERLVDLTRIVEVQSENIQALRNAVTPKPVAKPTLKWFEQEPQPIDWCVCCDPARLVLTPGTTLRYNIDDEVITTYDGVTIGELNSLGHNIICEGVKLGAKVHVYLTTARKLGIKLGRPA